MKSLNTDLSRRRAMLAIAALGGSVFSRSLFARTEPLRVEVWLDPNCGCCKDWIAHLEENGFTVKVFSTGRAAARQRFGMPEKYASCHTARVKGYTLEGHVPAHDIQRLLRERPDAVGLAVPAMPIGSPGMDGPAYGGHHDPYDVLLILKDGSARVFQSYL